MHKTDEAARQRTTTWLHRAVVGLELCPFAEPVVRRNRVHIAVIRASGLEEAVRAVLGEAVALVETPASERSTTLVVFADGLGAFDALLDAADLVEGALSEAGADGLLQLATFHPEYRFADVAPDHLGNYTNRAPYPIIQLLRVEEVGQAVDGHPDPDGIPARNVARLEELGRDEVERLWREWESDG